MFGELAALQGRESWVQWLIDRHDDTLWTLMADAGYVPGLRGVGYSMVDDLPFPSDVATAAEAFRVATVELIDALQEANSLADARSRDIAATIWAGDSFGKSGSP